FLRHLERTKVLVHLVDVSGASGRDPRADLDTVRRELELFRPELARRPQVVAANKIDAVDPDAPHVAALAARATELALPFFRISAVTGAGVPKLVGVGWQRLGAERASLPAGSLAVPLDDQHADRGESRTGAATK